MTGSKRSTSRTKLRAPSPSVGDPPRPAELSYVSLPDALEIVLLLVEEPGTSHGRRSVGTPVIAANV